MSFRLSSYDMVELFTQLGYDEKSAKDATYQMMIKNGETVSLNAFMFGVMSNMNKRILELEHELENQKLLQREAQERD